jgi:hypothetical protein
MKICQLGIYAEENKKNQLDIHVNNNKKRINLGSIQMKRDQLGFHVNEKGHLELTILEKKIGFNCLVIKISQIIR